jgi:hypothetical protein
MHKTKIILEVAIIAIIIGVLGFQNFRLSHALKRQIGSLQVTKYIVSDEPERIQQTLLKTYPYLKVWGPDVVYYWSGIIYDQCDKRKIDWRVVCAKIHCESGFNPKAISDMGAKGIAQTLDSTAAVTGRKLGITFIPNVTQMNDVAGMIIGIQYLDQNIKREKSLENGLKSYYAGGGWRKNPKQGPINEYATNVLTEARRLDATYKRMYPQSEGYFLR